MSASSIITRSRHDSVHDDSIHAEESYRLDESSVPKADFLTDLRTEDLTIGIKHRWYLPLRAACDFLLAAILLVVATPVIAIAAVIVKCTSNGPAFYLQTRVGRNGRTFSIIKLRTMVNDAEALSGPVWADKEDSRVTPFGRFLRNTHLDEFPQLVNVVFGQMSLIGPRPERPEFVAKLEWELPHYRTRLKLRPGITGLPQLLLPPDSDLDCVRRKLICDLFYVHYVSPWLDLRILCATAWHLLKMVVYYVRKMLALPDTESIQQNLQQMFDSQRNQRPHSFCVTSTEESSTE